MAIYSPGLDVLKKAPVRVPSLFSLTRLIFLGFLFLEVLNRPPALLGQSAEFGVRVDHPGILHVFQEGEIGNAVRVESTPGKFRFQLLHQFFSPENLSLAVAEGLDIFTGKKTSEDITVRGIIGKHAKVKKSKKEFEKQA